MVTSSSSRSSPTPTSCAAVSRARTSVRRGGGEASRVRTAACGGSSTASSSPAAPARSSSRTSRAARPSGCPTCGTICTMRATEPVPTRFLPPTSAPPISDDASSSSELLPTPSAVRYGTNRGGAAGRVGRERPSLDRMASAGLWPTPTVRGNHNRAGVSSRSGDGLATAVTRWPTPCARDWRSGASNLHDQNARPLNEVVSRYTPGPLNPEWVGLLMGFPPGWID